MPGPVSDSYRGPPEGSPYIPAHVYPKGPRACPCGHHEGYHDSNGACVRVNECGCTGLPADRLTPDDEMLG